MASPARPASVSGPFGSAADLAIFSTLTTMRRADPGRASETAARSSMARTRSGPRRPNQVRLLPQLSRFTGDLPRMATTSDPFSLICSGGRLSHHRRCVLNAEIRRAKAKLLKEDPPKLHAGHSPPPHAAAVAAVYLDRSAALDSVRRRRGLRRCRHSRLCRCGPQPTLPPSSKASSCATLARLGELAWPCSLSFLHAPDPCRSGISD